MMRMSIDIINFSAAELAKEQDAVAASFSRTHFNVSSSVTLSRTSRTCVDHMQKLSPM
jgi:hypothetical protein